MNEDFWRGMSVLVTGATGFLGAWVTMVLLKLGAKVVGLVRDGVAESNFRLSRLGDRVDVVHGSLEDYPTLERVISDFEVTTIFHLAAQALVGVAARCPLSTILANVMGTANVLEAVRRTRCVRRIVTASSDKAYGDQEHLPYTEDQPLQGRYPYDVSKSCADLLARGYWHSFFRSMEPPVLLGVARCANLFGGGDFNWRRVIPRQVRCVIHGGDLLYNLCVRQFLYVLDAARAYVLLAEKLHEPGVPGQAYNFGAEDSTLSMKELVAGRIVQVACRRGHATPRARQLFYPPGYPTVPARAARNGERPQGHLEYPPREIRDQYLSCAKARRLLGWRPTYSLAEGLEDSFAWYEAWFDDRDMAEVNRQMLESFLAATRSETRPIAARDRRWTRQHVMTES